MSMYAETTEQLTRNEEKVISMFCFMQNACSVELVMSYL